MAVPNPRDHGHQRVAGNDGGLQAFAVGDKHKIAIAHSSAAALDAPPSADEEDDADISNSDEDSEDDSGGDSSEDSQEEGDAHSTTVQPNVTPVQRGPATTTSFQDYVQTASQAKKSSKRPTEEDIQPEYKESTLKKRKALQDISGSNSRTNIFATVFVLPEAKLATAQNKPVQIATMALVKAGQQKSRAASTSGLLRASKSGNNWPRTQDSAEFSGAALADQRSELNNYRNDLFSYTDMIQAGAIPIQFVKSFLRRLDIHMEQMDKSLQMVECLHMKDKKRQSKLLRLHQESMKDHEEAGHLLTDLILPATYDP